MKAFLSIKFWGDDRNRDDVERICQALERLGLTVFCFRRDVERWGENQCMPSAMMEGTFAEIDSSDVLVANVADWPIGVGVEAGYAYARGKPVICIAPESSSVPNTMSGLAVETVRYGDYDDLGKQMSALISRLR
jgi:2'-deoxynucleoside 5'-phosphate N-hydrolase